MAVLAVVLAAGCGGGGSGDADKKAAITKNWEAFFNGTTPTDTRVSLLEDGERFASAVDSLDNSPLAKQATTKVTSVKLDSATSATVTFTVLIGGSAVVKDVKGTAVLVDDIWKISSKSLCELAGPLGVAPEGCDALGPITPAGG